MNRLTYDTCAYMQELTQSVSPLSYSLDPMKFEHCKKCRPELGIVGGTNVSHPRANMVDVENNLRGADRPSTKCPKYKFLPSADMTIQGKEYIKPVRHPRLDTRTLHLTPCQMTSYPPVPATPRMDLFSCKR